MDTTEAQEEHGILDNDCIEILKEQIKRERADLQPCQAFGET